MKIWFLDTLYVYVYTYWISFILYINCKVILFSFDNSNKGSILITFQTVASNFVRLSLPNILPIKSYFGSKWPLLTEGLHIILPYHSCDKSKFKLWRCSQEIACHYLKLDLWWCCINWVRTLLHKDYSVATFQNKNFENNNNNFGILLAKMWWFTSVSTRYFLHLAKYSWGQIKHSAIYLLGLFK